jgi:membrane-associated phospholipid phosphatase
MAGSPERALLVAAGALSALTLLALVLDDAGSLRRLDLSARRLAGSAAARRADRILAPLFPVGLPGVYIPLAHLLAAWLGRGGARQTWRIPATAWSAWLAHRGVKLVYRRERPRGRDRAGERKPRRTDSYPSGHTTGITALSAAIAGVLGELDVGADAAHVQRGVEPLRRATRIAPFVMAAQRLLADDHWATDTLGGLALGTAVAQSCGAYAKLIREG